MSLTVVVDGGGTGCRLAVFNSQGVQCATANAGPASLSLGVDQAWKHISQGIASLATQMNQAIDWQPKRLCMGLSGSLQTNNRENFLALLPNSISPILVTDGHAQLIGAAGGQAGACLAVGTGSVLHWQDNNGAFGMAGGWGFPMGDEGSGAWLGAQLINAYLWHCDTQQAGTDVPLVFSMLEDRIGKEISQIQLWSTNTRSTELASLAPIVTTCAQTGDKLANALLDRGTQLLQKLLAIAPDETPIYLVGGLGDIYLARFEQHIRARCQSPRGNVFSGLYSISQSQGISAA